ncbi:formyltransferase family protein [Actinomadura darangshiensis]|nr:formyltransferase family protein [Actinomadura darangshiensis]
MDLKVLHGFETTSVLRPPVAANTAALTPAIASAWLTLAMHWIGVAAESADLRFLNGACKLLGAVAIHPAAGPELPQQITMAAHLLNAATDSLQADLANRLAPTAQFTTKPVTPGLHAGATPHPKSFTVDEGSGREHDRSRRRPRIMMLAGVGSGSPAQLAEMTAAAGVRLTAVCWYGPPSDGPAATPSSSYDQAWYPPDQPTTDQTASGPQPEVGQGHAASNIPQIHAHNWGQVAEALNRHAADLVILAGMPIVPAAVLSLARLGVINAHNGALPTYRGMDAVAWALLNNDPIVCTLHRAEPGVDTGSVYASAAVPIAPAGTLRARTKHTQLQLLTAAAVHVATTGSLPAATAQAPGLGRQFYRLHPHLKRVLDASPFAGPVVPEPKFPLVSDHHPPGGALP